MICVWPVLPESPSNPDLLLQNNDTVVLPDINWNSEVHYIHENNKAREFLAW